MPIEARILLSLLAILGASGFVYWALVRRITTQRAWLELCDWAGSNRLAIRAGESAEVPAPLPAILSGARARLSLHNERTNIARIEAGEAQAVALRNILVRRIEVEWPRTALRPVKLASSLVDAYALPSLPSLTPGVRFVVHGVNAEAAYVLVRSALLTLMPPDLALILDGNWLILDFSARPFDPLELHRTTSLAEQLVANLPGPKLGA